MEEKRIPLLPSKMLEPDGKVASAEHTSWYFSTLRSLTMQYFSRMLWIFIPFYLACVASLCLSQVQYYGLTALLHVQLLIPLALISACFLVGTLIFVSWLLSHAISTFSFTAFPGELFINEDGFSYGDDKRFIPWHQVQLAQSKELIYRGRRRSEVIELNIIGQPQEPFRFSNFIKWRQRMLSADPLELTHHFYDPLSKHSPTNEYEGRCLRIPADLFGFDADYRRFLKALKQNTHNSVFHCAMPSDAPDTEADSFTAIWLDELKQGGGSERRLLEPGHRLQNGLYTLDKTIGYGGFSVVYAAHSEDNEKLAIKEIVINSGGTRASKEAILKQIVREIEILKTLDHPNIVKCLDYFIDCGRIYIVMQALQGKNLRDFVNDSGPLPEKVVVSVGRQCCSILSYLHDRTKPLIHRDFTPDNLIWDGQTVKLVDFNVAEEVNTNSSQTIVGKHSYLAPEQWYGNFGATGDLYQLGGSLFFLATGQDPEPLTQSKPSNLRPQLSDGFNQIVSKLTAKLAEDRYISAAETALAFDSLQSTERSTQAGQI